MSYSTSLYSYAKERVTNKTLQENTFSNVRAGSLIKITSDKGADNEFEKHQDDELQQKPPAFEKASDIDLDGEIVLRLLLHID